MMDRAVSGERDAFGFPKPGAETDPLPLEVWGTVYWFGYPPNRTVRRCRQIWRTVERLHDLAGGRVEAYLNASAGRKLVPSLLGDNELALLVLGLDPDRLVFVVQTLIVWAARGRKAALRYWNQVGWRGVHGAPVPPPPPLAGQAAE